MTRLATSGCLLASLYAVTTPEVRIRSAAWFPPGLVISSEAKLVEVGATVHDRHGRAVSDLHAADFEVLDNKREREITFFSKRHSERTEGTLVTAGSSGETSSTTQPSGMRYVALFFDDTHMSTFAMRSASDGARRLIENTLTANDLVGIYTSSGATWLDFSRDREKLLATIGRLEARPPSGVHATTVCPTLYPDTAYIIANHLDLEMENAAVSEAAGCNCRDESTLKSCEAAQRIVVESMAQNVWQQHAHESKSALDAILFLIRHLAGAPGDRLLILISPGFPAGGMEDKTSAITNAALRADITIGGINSTGLVTGRRLTRMQFLLSDFMAGTAKATGGKYLHQTNDIAAGLRTLVANPETSYVLGFVPSGNPDGKYHALKTRIRGHPDYRVDARPFYFDTALPERETAQERLNRIALSNDEIEDFPAALDVSERAQQLSVTISVQANKLKFPVKQGRRVQELTFLTVLEDPSGNFIAGKQSVMDVAALSGTLVKMQRDGVKAVTSFPAPAPGSYRIREVIREAAENHIWASERSIEIH